MHIPGSSRRCVLRWTRSSLLRTCSSLLPPDCLCITLRPAALPCTQILTKWCSCQIYENCMCKRVSWIGHISCKLCFLALLSNTCN